MKRILAILLVLAMVFSFAACGSKEDTSSDTGASSTITSTEGDKTSSSETTNNESTGDAITSNTTSDSSSEQNTSKPTESSKPADTSKPTTSKPTESTSSSDCPHDDRLWKQDKIATYYSEGQDIQMCHLCNQWVTRKLPKISKHEAISSFGENHEVRYLTVLSEDGKANFNIHQVICVVHSIFYDPYVHSLNGNDLPVEIPLDQVIDAAKANFKLESNFAEQLKASKYYNASNNTVMLHLCELVPMVNDNYLRAYEDLGNNEYIFYFRGALCTQEYGKDPVYSNIKEYKARVKIVKYSKYETFVLARMEGYLYFYSFEEIQSIPSSATLTDYKYAF